MKYLIFVVILMTASIRVFAQLHLDDPAYKYQTVDGKILADQEVNKLLHSRQHFSLKEIANSNGTFTVTLIPISNKEFHKIIKEKKKLARQMKGQQVPDFTLKDEKGESISNYTFDKQKVTVYNFWFTTCPHCIEEIPKLNLIVKDFPKGVTFIAPTFNTHTQVAKFLESNVFDYHIITNGKSLAEMMHIRSYPSHYIVDQEGIIRKIYIGSSNRVIKQVRKEIMKLLKE